MGPEDLWGFMPDLIQPIEVWAVISETQARGQEVDKVMRVESKECERITELPCLRLYMLTCCLVGNLKIKSYIATIYSM